MNTELVAKREFTFGTRQALTNTAFSSWKKRSFNTKQTQTHFKSLLHHADHSVHRCTLLTHPPTLSIKHCWVTSLEKQNFSLADFSLFGKHIFPINHNLAAIYSLTYNLAKIHSCQPNILIQNLRHKKILILG